MSTDYGDITSGYHGGNTESNEAYASIIPTKVQQRDRVVRYIATRGEAGASCAEVEEALNISHQSCSARFTEAKAAKAIIATGDRRRTTSGRYASVYKAAS